MVDDLYDIGNSLEEARKKSDSLKAEWYVRTAKEMSDHVKLETSIDVSCFVWEDDYEFMSLLRFDTKEELQLFKITSSIPHEYDFLVVGSQCDTFKELMLKCDVNF